MRKSCEDFSALSKTLIFDLKAEMVRAMDQPKDQPKELSKTKSSGSKSKEDGADGEENDMAGEGGEEEPIEEDAETIPDSVSTCDKSGWDHKDEFEESQAQDVA